MKKEKNSVSEKNKKPVKKNEVKKNRKKAGVLKSVFNFFKGIKNEMGKVTWPSKKNMVKYTVATVVFIVFFALFFYAIILLLGLLKDLIVII